MEELTLKEQLLILGGKMSRYCAALQKLASEHVVKGDFSDADWDNWMDDWETHCQK